LKRQKMDRLLVKRMRSSVLANARVSQ
jgi:hypothetical protein